MKFTNLILCLPAMAVAAPLAAKHKKNKEPWPGKSKFVGPSDWDLDAIPCPKCNLWARPDMRHSGDKEDYDALYVAPLVDRAEHPTYGGEEHIHRPQIHGNPTYQSRPTLIHDDPVPHQERNIIPKPRETLEFTHIDRPVAVLYYHHEDNLYKSQNFTATNGGSSNTSTISYPNATQTYQANTTEILKHIEEIIRHEIDPNWAPKSRIHARDLPNGQKLFDTQLPQTKSKVSEAQVGTTSTKHITERGLGSRGPTKPYPILLDLPKYPGEDLMAKCELKKAFWSGEYYQDCRSAKTRGWF